MDNRGVIDEDSLSGFLWFISHERYFRYLFALILVLISLSLFLFFQVADEKEDFCEGFENECLDVKPYYCSNDGVVEKASVCGCPEGLERDDDQCRSQYHTDPKEINLRYTLNKEEGEIKFIVFGGLVDYLSELPRSIDSNVIENPSRADFKFKKIDEEIQRTFLMPLVLEIKSLTDEKEEQMKIAVSVVQNIEWGYSNRKVIFGGSSLAYSRYPYEILYDSQGICGEKSELLLFLLRELGYETVLFYNLKENHESVGVKCPLEYSWNNSGYCFIETSGPAVISDTSISYVNGLRLESQPQIFKISDGLSLGENLQEYKDAKTLIKIRGKVAEKGEINVFDKFRLDRLKDKYGLASSYNLE